jgi:dUTP pyrophosphatase
MEGLPPDIAVVYPLRVKLLRKGAKAPTRGTSRSAGVDLYACLGDQDDSTASVVISNGHRAVIPTGVAVVIPEGHVGLCCPRSGLARHQGLTVLNAPGVIDEDYVGELGVIVINTDSATHVIKHGDRIAQLVITPVVYTKVEIVNDLPVTERGARGFGSTGRD